jgi:mercuric reductase
VNCQNNVADGNSRSHHRKGKYMTTLKITGMTCDSCAAHVKEALEKVPGVQSALVSYPKGTAQLAIEGHVIGCADYRRGRTGYEATLADAPPTDNRAGSTRCAAG